MHHLDNLALSCLGCNHIKYDAVAARDPVGRSIVPLFHPRTQRWIDHFEWDDTYTNVLGITPTGRATVARLQLNRIGLRNLRKALRASGKHPPQHSLRA